MSHHCARWVLSIIGTALCICLSLDLPAPGARASSTAAPATGAEAVRPARPVPAVLLINGDRVTVRATAGGGPVAAIVPAATSGLDGAVASVALGGHHYEVPAVALPYLGHGLDWSLFDLTALAGQEKDGRLPVRITFGSGRHDLPGVTITRSGAGTASGYLTASSAMAFGEALTRQMVADHARGRYGSDGMFAGGESISLRGVSPRVSPGVSAGARTAAPASPHLPMHTLTVTATDLAGQPDSGDVVFVVNADNSILFGDPYESFDDFYHGSTHFSVPGGHYFAVAMFMRVSGAESVSFRLVTIPQFSVSGNATAAVAETAATSKVAFVTPRAAQVAGITLTLNLVPAAGPELGTGLIVGAGSPVWVNPTTSPVTAGHLQVYTSGRLVSPAGAAVPYEYDLAYGATSGVVPPQRRVVPAASLAAVDAHFYQALASAGALIRIGFSATELASGLSGLIFPFHLPTHQIEYMTGNAHLFWLDQYWQSYEALTGGQDDALRVFTPGEHVREQWNAYPLHAGVNVNLAGASNPLMTLPSASRAGDTLTLDTTPFSDSEPGHTGSGFFAGIANGTVTGSYEIDENGQKIAGGDAESASGGAPDLFTQVSLSPAPSVLRFTLTASRTGTSFPLSASSQTVWTWQSHETRTRLPSDWQCGSPGVRHCAVEPLLTLRYAVRGLALNGSVPPGQQLLDISVGHLQLARATTITGATVAVSVDGGSTWQPVPVIPGGQGRFRSVFTAPSAGAVSLRVTAADAAGGQISETILRAYRVS